MAREVTEADFRRPEFRDAKPEDYEFDGTGEMARKDRWEMGIRTIIGMLEDAGLPDVSRRRFVIADAIAAIDGLIIRNTIDQDAGADRDALMAALQDNDPLNTEQRSALYKLVVAHMTPNVKDEAGPTAPRRTGEAP